MLIYVIRCRYGLQTEPKCEIENPKNSNREKVLGVTFDNKFCNAFSKHYQKC